MFEKYKQRSFHIQYSFLTFSYRWQRIQNRPSWVFLDGQFLLTFVHRFTEPAGASTYFAFAYPWSYTETQQQLDHIQATFDLGDRILRSENSPTCQPKAANSGTATPPVSQFIDAAASAELSREIYFHRELLCYSLECRRVDLITITDWHGYMGRRESYFDPLLFPDRSHPRPWKFDGKKVGGR